MDARTLAGLRIASIGYATSGELMKHGIVPDLQPDDESSDGLIKLFQDLKIRGQQILIPRSDIALPLLTEGLLQAGNKVTPVTVYHNVPPVKADRITPGAFDYIVFCSPSGVENFFASHAPEDFLNQKFIVQGRVTMKMLVNCRFPEEHVITREAFERMFD
jgi:uroporphyrinogen III methyltransferase/synthase